MKRRDAVQLMGYAGLGIIASPLSPFKSMEMLKRPIPSSGELLPIVGLGTWIQFDVGNSASARKPLLEVIRHMAGKGGKIIDSSPMYGKSEAVIGDLTNEAKLADKFFYATKVWTSGRQAGIDQMENSMKKMRRQTMDLMQIHNLVDWQTHMETLRKWKDEGKIRYIGITHYTDSAHDQLEKIIQSERIDFMQFNYSIRSRHAEKRLLGVAKDNGVAVIINQPFESGSLIEDVRGKALPPWATDLGISNWAQYFLKYLLSHPAVNYVIPGTSDPVHVVENMEAAIGKLPEEKDRKKMIDYFEKLSS